MSQLVIIPRMGQTMTEGTVARFLVKDGDKVQADTEVYELEYDKSTANIPAKKAGTIRLLVDEGAVVPLGQPVAVVLEDGETLESVNLSGSKNVAVATEKPGVAAAVVTPVVKAVTSAVKELKYAATPKIKKLASDMGIDLTAVVPADGKRITKEDLDEFAKKAAAAVAEVGTAVASVVVEGFKVSPLARKVAEELGVDLGKVVPADGRRVTRDDVQAYAAANKGAAAPAAPAGDRREPLKGMRKVIAERMTVSHNLYPSATLTTKIDMTDFLKMRVQLNAELAKKDIKLTVTDLLLKAVAKALRDNEVINTSLEENEIVYHADVNIGLAVSVPNGLVVPVIRNTDKLSVEEIFAERKRLVDKAKNGGLSGADMKDGTFSVSNLGMFGVDGFTPMINMPQSAILGIGRTVEEPAVVNGQICIRSKAVFSITHDHRVIDGTDGAKFLQSLTHYIENPCLLLL